MSNVIWNLRTNYVCTARQTSISEVLLAFAIVENWVILLTNLSFGKNIRELISKLFSIKPPTEFGLRRSSFEKLCEVWTIILLLIIFLAKVWVSCCETKRTQYHCKSLVSVIWAHLRNVPRLISNRYYILSQGFLRLMTLPQKGSKTKILIGVFKTVGIFLSFTLFWDLSISRQMYKNIPFQVCHLSSNKTYRKIRKNILDQKCIQTF